MFLTILPAPTAVWLAAILLVVGLAVIIKGGDFFVDASVWMAEVFHMPKFLIGATIVSLATTLPEMIVSIIAVAGGDYSISVGNAVGSVTANTGLILALSAIFVSGTIDKKDFGIKALLIIVAGVILLAFSLDGSFGIIESILLIIVLVVYMIQTIKSAKKNSEEVKTADASDNQENIENKESEKEEVKKDKKTVIWNIIKFILGTAGIVLGADLLVTNSQIVAKAIGISEGIIAVTVVAIGTSLPELVTTITSIVKKQGELGVGNIIGANIIDLVLILPICSVISGFNLEVVDQSRYLDMPSLLVVSLVAVVPAFITGKFKKWQGLVLLLLYAVYLFLAVRLFNIA